MKVLSDETVFLSADVGNSQPGRKRVSGFCALRWGSRVKDSAEEIIGDSHASRRRNVSGQKIEP